MAFGLFEMRMWCDVPIWVYCRAIVSCIQRAHCGQKANIILNNRFSAFTNRNSIALRSPTTICCYLRFMCNDYRSNSSNTNHLASHIFKWLDRNAALSQFLLKNLYVIVDHICLHFASDVRRRANQVATIKSQWIYVLMLHRVLLWTPELDRDAIGCDYDSEKMSRQINYAMLSLLAQHAIDLHTGFSCDSILFCESGAEWKFIQINATGKHRHVDASQCPLSQYSIAHRLRWVCCAYAAVYFPNRTCVRVYRASYLYLEPQQRLINWNSMRKRLYSMLSTSMSIQVLCAKRRAMIADHIRHMVCAAAQERRHCICGL